MLKELETKKEQFWKDHEIRMAELNAAINDLKKKQIETSIESENTRLHIQQALAEMDATLDSLLEE